MRLMKWWRDQQAWSCPLTTPSDYVLELIVIYAADEVVARPAGLVLPAYDAVGLRARAHRHLRGAAVRQGGAGADDRELHVAARALRSAPRRLVELLRPDRCVVAVDAAEAALDGPREPLHERGGPAGLRCPRVDGVRVVDALLLVSWR